MSTTRIYPVTDTETNKHQLAGGPATADMFEEATLVNAGGTD